MVGMSVHCTGDLVYMEFSMFLVFYLLSLVWLFGGTWVHRTVLDSYKGLCIENPKEVSINWWREVE